MTIPPSKIAFKSDEFDYPNLKLDCSLRLLFLRYAWKPLLPPTLPSAYHYTHSPPATLCRPRTRCNGAPANQQLQCRRESFIWSRVLVFDTRTIFAYRFGLRLLFVALLFPPAIAIIVICSTWPHQRRRRRGTEDSPIGGDHLVDNNNKCKGQFCI